MGELRKHFSERMFKTIVNFNTKLKEAASLGQPIAEYDPASKGNKDFMALAEELIGTDTQMHRAELVSTLQSKLDAISASAEELLASVEQPTPPKEVEQQASPKEIEQPMPAQEAEQPMPPEEIELQTLVKEIEQPAPPQEVKQPAPVEEVKQQDFDTKIADFYGVRQVEDAVMFVTLYPRADNVQIAGDFNGWQPEQTTLEKISENGAWQIKLPLAAGKYRYRLVVDGQWQQDPYNENTELNPYGDLNSVLEVK